MKFTPVRAVAVLLVFLLVVGVAGLSIGLLLEDDDASGGNNDATPTLAPTPTPQPGSTEAPAADLAPFYSQTLSWEPCRDDFECATLTVPIDYADPGGETIDLSAEVFQSPSPPKPAPSAISRCTASPGS